jgi:anti-anti-sigma factor
MAAQRSDMEVIRSGEQGDILCLRVQGTIQQDPINPQPDPLPDALGSTGFGGKVLLDLSGVEFLDSSGYNWLLQQNRAFRNAGGALALHSIPPLVMRILSLVRADLVFQIAGDETAAMKMLREAKA